MCFYQYFKLLHSPSLINKSSLFILELQSINESQPCWNSISCYIIPIDANFECLSSSCGRMSLIASINWSPVFQSIPQPSISMLSTNPLLFILNLARHTPVFALGLSEWLKNTTTLPHPPSLCKTFKRCRSRSIHVVIAFVAFGVIEFSSYLCGGRQPNRVSGCLTGIFIHPIYRIEVLAVSRVTGWHWIRA